MHMNILYIRIFYVFVSWLYYICAIFLLFMESNDLEKSTNSSVAVLIFTQKFLDFGLDTITKQGLINFISLNRASVDFEVAFLGEQKDKIFVHSSTEFFIDYVAWSEKHVVKFSCLPNLRRYSFDVCSFVVFLKCFSVLRQVLHS